MENVVESRTHFDGIMIPSAIVSEMLRSAIEQLKLPQLQMRLDDSHYLRISAEKMTHDILSSFTVAQTIADSASFDQMVPMDSYASADPEVKRVGEYMIELASRMPRIPDDAISDHELQARYGRIKTLFYSS